MATDPQLTSATSAVAQSPAPNAIASLETATATAAAIPSATTTTCTNVPRANSNSGSSDNGEDIGWLSEAIRGATCAADLAHLGPHLGAPASPLSWIAWGMDKVGALLPWTNFSWTALQVEQLRRTARETCEMPGYEDVFGTPDEYLRGVDAYYCNLSPEKMTPTGIFWFNTWQSGVLEGRKKIVRYILDNPDVYQPSSRVNKVIMIAGYFRSGTTLMHRMMAAQPATRSLHVFEMIDFADPTHYVTNREQLTTDTRIAQCRAQFDQFEKLYPGFWKRVAESHLTDPSEPDEEVVLFMYTSVHVLSFGVSGHPYSDWIANPNKNFIYRFLRMFMQMLNQGTTWPVTHWVIKSPLHMLYLDSFTEEFSPSFGVVFLHRDPVDGVPSFCRLMETWTSVFFQDKFFDLGLLGRLNLWMCKLSWDRVMAWQRKTDPSMYYNLQYRTFTKDPVGELEKIYNHFHIPMDGEARAAAIDYLNNNQQGKHGRANYSPERYGLTKELIHSVLSDYMEWSAQFP
ncbi:sulfotransferase family protein [Pelomyxa schiedti]|nr:sulfotransferase family protein [Pelomyxa schiedti]